MTSRTDDGCMMCGYTFDETVADCYYCGMTLCPKCQDLHQEEAWPCTTKKYTLSVIDGGKK